MNVDKERIKKVADKYKGKSEKELMDELKKMSKDVKDQDRILEKLKPLLNPQQQAKLDKILKQIK